MTSIDTAPTPAAASKALLTSLSYYTLWTGDGLPDCDRQVIQQCRSRLLSRASLGFLGAGGLMGGMLYGRGLLTPARRALLTSVFAMWGSAAAALTSTPSCLRSVSAITDTDSVLKHELSRIVVQHNPNVAMQHAQQRHSQQ